MWSFASHAGTGLAVAGLSATYYALARKNAELERANAVGEVGDGGDFGDTGFQDDLEQQETKMTTSQLLLKNEFEVMTRDSGHTLGLNVVERPLPEVVQSVPSQYSGMNIRQIVSRVQTSMPIKPLLFHNRSRDSRETKGDKNEKDDTAGEEIKVIKKPKSPPSSSNQAESESVSAMTKSEKDEMREYIQKLKIPQPDGNTDDSGFLSDIQVAVVQVEIPQKEKSAKEVTQKEESKPNFANTPEQYVYEEQETFSEDNLKEIETSDESCPVVDELDYSTENISVVLGDAEDFEDEILNNADQIKDVEKEESIESLPAMTNAQMDEMRDYNLQLQMHHIQNTDDSGFLSDTPVAEVQEEMYPKEEEKPLEEVVGKEESNGNFTETPENYVDEEKEAETEDNFNYTETKEDSLPTLEKYDYDTYISGAWGDSENFEDDDILNNAFINEEDYEEDACANESSPIIERIPDSSWICLPARVYADCEATTPALIIFMALVVLVFGLLGKFFILLADWFELNEIDDNPNAMLEH